MEQRTNEQVLCGHTSFWQLSSSSASTTNMTRGSEQSSTLTKTKKLIVEQSRPLEDMAAKLEWTYKPKEGDDKKFVAGSKLPDSVKKGYTEPQQFIQDKAHQ